MEPDESKPPMWHLGEFSVARTPNGRYLLAQGTGDVHMAIDNFECDPGEYVVVCMRKRDVLRGAHD